MDMFKIGDLVVSEGGGPVMTVAQVMDEGGRQWVRFEGAEPNSWALGNCLSPYMSPVAFA
jgi:hypothetical protein